MNNDIFEIIHSVLAPIAKNMTYAAPAYCPSVKQVIDNKPVTVVKFTDGTKAVVKCSDGDDYNLETAILYAIVKRTFASRIDSKTGEAVCAGLGNSLKKIISTMTIHPAEEKSLTKTTCVPGKCMSVKTEKCSSYKPVKSKIAQLLDSFSVKGNVKSDKTISGSTTKKPSRKRDARGRFI